MRRRWACWRDWYRLGECGVRELQRCRSLSAARHFGPVLVRDSNGRNQWLTSYVVVGLYGSVVVWLQYYFVSFRVQTSHQVCDREGFSSLIDLEARFRSKKVHAWLYIFISVTINPNNARINNSKFLKHNVSSKFLSSKFSQDQTGPTIKKVKIRAGWGRRWQRGHSLRGRRRRPHNWLGFRVWWRWMGYGRWRGWWFQHLAIWLSNRWNWWSFKLNGASVATLTSRQWVL